MKRATLLFGSIALSAGCSGAIESPSPSSDPSAPPAVASAPAAPEGARVDAFLNARYTAADVRSTFRTALGEDVDCIDFFAQAAERERAKSGRPLTEIPIPPPPPHGGAIDGAPTEAEASAPRCAAGTVAQRHIAREEIAAAGGLDAFLARRTPPMPPTEISGFAHVTADFDTLQANLGPITEGVDTFSIHQPALGASGGHSLSQSWITSGSHRLAECFTNDPDCEQSAEVGWWVTTPGGPPTLFIFGTNHGYAPPNREIPFHAISVAHHEDEILPPSVSGTEHELTTVIYLQAATSTTLARWWIAVRLDSGPLDTLGFFEGYLASMTSGAQLYQVGGEVQSNSGNFFGFQMGNGPAIFGFPSAAYHRNFFAWVPATSDLLTTPTYYRDTNGAYTYATGPAPGASSWTNYFYFGATFIF